MTLQPIDPEMTCARAEELLEPFVDGELEPEVANALGAHIALCSVCTAELTLAQSIRTGLRALPELEPPPSILDRVRAQAAAEGAAVVPFPNIHRTGRRWAIPAALAAALAGLLATALLLRAPRPAEPSTAQVQVAEQQARYALAYIGKVTREASLTLRDDVLERRVVLPTALSVERPLDPRPGALLDRHSTKGT